MTVLARLDRGRAGINLLVQRNSLTVFGASITRLLRLGDPRPQRQ
jgi:hypothetical protein